MNETENNALDSALNDANKIPKKLGLSDLFLVSLLIFSAIAAVMLVINAINRDLYNEIIEVYLKYRDSKTPETITEIFNSAKERIMNALPEYREN